MEASEVRVSVRRHPQDWKTATYRLQDVEGLHWSDTSGGVGRATAKPALFGYVLCDAMLDGELAHSCRHGPPPHRILVCLPRVENPEAWSLLKRAVAECGSAGQSRPHGLLVARAICAPLEAKRARAAARAGRAAA